MNQNLISLTMTPDELTAIDASIADLETRLQGLIDLTTGQRRSVQKMGQKSEQFCRQIMNVMKLNPKVVPEGVGLVDALADLSSLDAMRPRFERLHRLSQRAADSELALGSDVMRAALQGYAMLRAIGASHGLEAVSRELSARFSKTRRVVPDEEAAAA